jgi:SAM-dependent methyltransferase
MPDRIFAEPRLARLYDAVDDDRSDLDAYLAMVGEFGARRVLDIGCGTGTLACLLAARGIEVIGADPAGASLDVARRKPGADRVRWLQAAAADLPAGLEADLATMTGNVAQVFVTDQDWAAALAAARGALRPGGRLVFETRDPARAAWRFRGRDELTAALTAAGLTVDEVRDAPDRPGLEFVFITRRGAQAAEQKPERSGFALVRMSPPRRSDEPTASS